MKLLLFLLFPTFIGGAAGAAGAAASPSDPPVPGRIQFQARILDPNANPLSLVGLPVTVRIWDAPIGGNELYSETQTPVITGGMLVLTIGATQQLPAALFEASSERWLGLSLIHI